MSDTGQLKGMVAAVLVLLIIVSAATGSHLHTLLSDTGGHEHEFQIQDQTSIQGVAKDDQLGRHLDFGFREDTLIFLKNCSCGTREGVLYSIRDGFNERSIDPMIAEALIKEVRAEN